MSTHPAGDPTRYTIDGAHYHRYAVSVESLGTDDYVQLSGLPPVCTLTLLRVIVTDDNGGAVSSVTPAFFAVDTDTPSNLANSADDLGATTWSGSPGRLFEAGDYKRLHLEDGSLFVHPGPDAGGGTVFVEAVLMEGHHA